MLKKPGAFSNRYMSNPHPISSSTRQSHLNIPKQKDRNKQNRYLNSNVNTLANNTIEHQHEQIQMEMSNGQNNHCNNVGGQCNDVNQNGGSLGNHGIVIQKDIKKLDNSSLSANSKRLLSKKQLHSSNKSIGLNSISINTRQRQQWQKQQKDLKLQISKLKKQNTKLKQQAKRANKTNQQNICSYETYIKEIQAERDQMENKKKIYGEQLKYCILWIVEAFSLALANNKGKIQFLLENKLGKNKMAQVFQKLNKTVQELQLQKYLQQVAKAQPPIVTEQYLLYQKQKQRKSLQQKINPKKPTNTHTYKYNNHHKTQQQSLQQISQLNQLLDTFDLRKQTDENSHKNCPKQNFYGNQNDRYFQYQHQQAEQYKKQNIARRLFVNQDTFGQQIGEHDISGQLDHSNQNQKAIYKSNTQKYMISQSAHNSIHINENLHRQQINGGTVIAKRSYEPEDDDYLHVKKGDEIKLLRKVGGLWIAQNGAKIGYISQNVLY